MAGPDHIEGVLERLGRAMAVHAPELRSSLRPPVRPSDLDELRRAVDPFDLPAAVEALLRWADGQNSAGPWLPAITTHGPLLSASAIVEHYRRLRDNAEDWQWSPLWLPIAHEGWMQVGVEMTDDFGAVVYVDWGSPDVTIVAPSLPVMLDATAEMIEAGLAYEPESGTAERGEWRDRCVLILESREEWRDWPYDRLIASEMSGWPPHWRVVAGLPAEPDIPHPVAEPISSVSAGVAGLSAPVTIEGYVTDRALIDGQASGNSIIALDDDSGSVRVLVRPDTEGSYWAAWVGRRIQADVLAGESARQQIDEVLDAEPERRRRAPVGTTLLAVEVRHAAQWAPNRHRSE